MVATAQGAAHAAAAAGAQLSIQAALARVAQAPTTGQHAQEQASPSHRTQCMLMLLMLLAQMIAPHVCKRM